MKNNLYNAFKSPVPNLHAAPKITPDEIHCLNSQKVLSRILHKSLRKNNLISRAQIKYCDYKQV